MKKHSNAGPLGANPKEKKAKDPSCRKIQIQRGNAGPLGAKPTEKKAKEPDCRETLIQPMKERGNAGPLRAKPKEKKAKEPGRRGDLRPAAIHAARVQGNLPGTGQTAHPAHQDRFRMQSQRSFRSFLWRRKSWMNSF
mmetsp:Transcript_53903/g.97049  ORF Transcript_53903/g.97049 Transcript_53903/m.97049 type:complete len:138 (+) Transcript_53903:581-994(+)